MGEGEAEDVSGDALGEPDDRLGPRVAPEQEEEQQRQQGNDRQQKGSELRYGGPG